MWCSISLLYSILVVLLILLCGDVELNPGPVMGKIFSNTCGTCFIRLLL